MSKIDLRDHYKPGDHVHAHINGDRWPMTIDRVTKTMIVTHNVSYTVPLGENVGLGGHYVHEGKYPNHFEDHGVVDSRQHKFSIKKNGRITKVGSSYFNLGRGWIGSRNPHV